VEVSLSGLHFVEDFPWFVGLVFSKTPKTTCISANFSRLGEHAAPRKPQNYQDKEGDSRATADNV
jgi:hypothetical protein